MAHQAQVLQLQEETIASLILEVHTYIHIMYDKSPHIIYLHCMKNHVYSILAKIKRKKRKNPEPPTYDPPPPPPPPPPFYVYTCMYVQVEMLMSWKREVEGTTLNTAATALW